MSASDRLRMFVAAAASLGVAVGCGGASARKVVPDSTSDTRQVIDGEARCGVGSSDEEASAAAAPAGSPPVSGSR